MAKKILIEGKNKLDDVILLCVDTELNSYMVYKESTNYCGHVKGGLKKTLCVVKKGMTYSESLELFKKRAVKVKKKYLKYLN